MEGPGVAARIPNVSPRKIFPNIDRRQYQANNIAVTLTIVAAAAAIKRDQMNSSRKFVNTPLIAVIAEAAFHVAIG